MKSFLILLAAMLLAGLSFLLASQWPVLFPDMERLPLDPACDLNAGPCERALPSGGKVRFSISPADIPLMKPLELKAQLESVAVTGLQVDIIGINMEMGINRSRMQSIGGGRWQGETILPVCSQKRMQWEAQLQIRDGEQTLAVPFRFETLRP